MKTLEEHTRRFHGGVDIRKVNSQTVQPSVYCGPYVLHIFSATHLRRPQGFWTKEYPFKSMIRTYQQLHAPVCIVEERNASNAIITIVNGHFSEDQINFMTSEATFLEREGKHTKRGEIKEGTRMVSFEVRYEYGMIGWYVHDNLQCYRRCEALASFICGHLRRLFSSIIQHLYRT